MRAWLLRRNRDTEVDLLVLLALLNLSYVADSVFAGVVFNVMGVCQGFLMIWRAASTGAKR